MICNLTQHDDKFFGEIDVISFKRDEVKQILGDFWIDAVPDFVLLAKRLTDIAVDSGASKAMIDVPPYAVSVLELELYTKGITPVHFYGEAYVELDIDRIIGNIREIVESSTLVKGEAIAPNELSTISFKEPTASPVVTPETIQDTKQRQARSREFSKEFFNIQIKKDFVHN